jgi:hypothetical protein
MHTETPQANDNNSSDNYRFSSSRQIKELKEKNVELESQLAASSNYQQTQMLKQTQLLWMRERIKFLCELLELGIEGLEAILPTSIVNNIRPTVISLSQVSKKIVNSCRIQKLDQKSVNEDL